MNPTLRKIIRALPLLTISAGEYRLLLFLAAQGKWFIWTIYSGDNVARSLAVQMDWPEQTAKTTLASLTRRGWVDVAKDHDDRKQVFITPVFGPICDRALERQRVRSALGPRLCLLYDITEEKVDRIEAEASNLVAPKRFADRVRLVARMMFEQPTEPQWRVRDRARRQTNVVPLQRQV